MIRALISPLTIYQIDNTIFDNIELPKRPFTDRGYDDLFLTGWDMDKTVFINNLLMETAELNVLYTNPQFFKFAVTQWALKEKAVWQSLYETIFFKYNPIWNKDGTLKHEALETRDLANGLTVQGSNSDNVREVTDNTRENETTETIDRDETSARTYSETLDENTTELVTPRESVEETTTYNTNENKDYSTVNGGTVTTTGSKTTSENVDTVNSGTDSTENKVSAYDVTTYQNRERTDTTKGTREDRDATGSETTSETITDGKTVRDTGDLAKTGTETVLTEHDGTNTRDVDVESTKHINDNLTEHEDNTDRTLNETITDSGTKTQTITGSDNRTESGTNTGTVENEYTDKEYGNIGVTMTQQLIEAERNLVKFNIYDVIIESFKQRFCLLIY